MSDLPPPLTPADCDLRGLPYMPLDVIRLLDSDMFAEATGDEFKAAVALWCKSWTQVPAASLPNKDKVLAHLSGNVEKWKRIKTGAMRGWILCSDDRWYHPVVAEKALAALPGREEFNSKKSAEAERKAREREDRKTLFEALKRHGVTPEWNVSTKTLRGMAAQYLSQEPPEHVTDPHRDMSQGVTVCKGEGEKKGEGELTLNPQADDDITDSNRDRGDFAPPTEAPLPPRKDPEQDDNNPTIALAVKLRTWGVNATFTHPAVQDWATREVSHDILAAAVAKARETKGDAKLPPNYLVRIVEELLNPPAKAEAAPQKQPGDDWYRSKAGIERKGRELGMFARGSESHDDFKDRIFAKLRNGAKPL